MNRLDAPPPAPTLGGLLRKYFTVYRVSLSERLVYRGDFLLGSVLRFLPMVTTILLWQAVYAGAGADELAGYRFREMIAYLLLVHISRMFSSMPGLAAGIGRDIRDGGLKKFLLQPLDLLTYLVSYRMAHKTAYIATSCLPYALLFFLCREFFDGLPPPPRFAGYAAALVMGFVIGFFMEATLGMLGFWVLEVSGFLYVINTLNFFVSGQMFPLELLPGGWPAVLRALPFQYLAYFPAAVFLGKIDGPELISGLAVEFAWAVGFVLLARVLYLAGLRRYSAFGG